MDIRKFVFGLDLGQAADFTALIGLERVTEAQPHTYHMRIAQRYPLRTPYTVIVDRLAAFVQEPPLAGQCTLVIDATGVGAPVVDMFKAASLACPFYPVIITGGNVVTKEGTQFHVPKRDLATAMKVLLDDKRLRISDALPDCRLLVTELENFRVKITTKAQDTYEAWREGQHDDLVLATALACWLAERGARQRETQMSLCIVKGISEQPDTPEEWARQFFLDEILQSHIAAALRTVMAGGSIDWQRYAPRVQEAIAKRLEVLMADARVNNADLARRLHKELECKPVSWGRNFS